MCYNILQRYKGENMITKIKNGKLILPDGVKNSLNLYFENERITHITEEELPYDYEIDAEERYVSPGFIDIHVHGGGGHDFMDGGKEAIIKAAELHMQYGTTSIMPTTLACTTETLLNFLKELKSVLENHLTKNRIIGAHLEGPYFSKEQAGAQNPEYIKSPQKDEYEYIIKEFGDIIKRWSFAPELSGSVEFCAYLQKNNISPSIGHSDAVYSDVEKVYEKGARTFTHLYSGMSSIVRKGGYRYLGVLESAYLLDGITAEVIADGCHLPKELLKLIVKQLGTKNICLVTDAMRGAGMPEGKSLLGRKGEGIECIIEDGIAKMPDRSCFAGSVATADRLVRTMVKQAGCSVYEAVSMMTENPARLLGMSNVGSLRVGNLADIVLFDDNINVSCVIANGVVYKDKM